MNIEDFRPRVRVIHVCFGKGIVDKVEGAIATVTFVNHGTKTLHLAFAAEKFTRGRGRPPKIVITAPFIPRTSKQA